jgi:hypothetical protein
VAKVAIAIGAAAAGIGISIATGGLGAFAVGAWVPDIIAGASAGLAVGSAINAIAFPGKRPLQYPLQDLQVSSSADGAPIPFGYNLCRFAGQIIWAPPIQFVQKPQESGGPSGGTTSSVYIYFASFAVAFGEGPGIIHRIWGDSKLIYKNVAIPGNIEPLGDLPEWDATVNYVTDDLVLYLTPTSQGLVDLAYQARYPNINKTPVGNSLYWAQVSDYPTWQRDTTYQPGAMVDYFGQIYVAIIPNLNDHPATHPNDWQPLASYYGKPTIYPGNETQNPDPIIQANEGVANTPAYRGLILAVWEKFPIVNFGNRVPNIRAEVEFTKTNNLL